MDRGESENYPVVAYGPFDGEYVCYFRSCPKCGRFVKSDKASKIPEYLGKEPNATCKKCGRVQMDFSHWWSEE